MKFSSAGLSGAFLVECERVNDERGYFARVWDNRIGADFGCAALGQQSSVAWNALRATLRGMHYQSRISPEAKLVRCTRGSIYDVIVDVRPDADTYLHWRAFELMQGDCRALYVPPLFAHGYITLVDDVEVTYMMSTDHRPGASLGVRWDDPAVAIEWPCTPAVISERDRGWPLLAGR